MANHLRTELVLEALNMAIAQRRPAGVIHHSARARVHFARFRQAVSGQGNRDLDRVRRRLLRQRDGRELLRDVGVRTHQAALIPDPCRSAHGHFRIHRRLVQHQTPSFRAGVLESQRVRTPHGGDHQAGPRRRSRPQPNRPRALPDRPAGDPQPPSGGTLNSGLPERFPSTGYRPPQWRWRQPSTVHRIDRRRASAPGRDRDARGC